jgi:hypothetical protein
MSERRGVIVDGGVVTNIVVWGDESQEQFSNEGHDRVEETTGWEYQPGMGWTWATQYGYRPPQPFASWIWNSDEFHWVPPTPMPTDEGYWYEWDEDSLSWVAHEIT